MADWGLVLAGGGGKGAYQMGVWKCLCEQGCDKLFGAFSGTSVGALNAALFTQGDPERAEAVWRGITRAQILSPKEAQEVKEQVDKAREGDQTALENFFRLAPKTAAAALSAASMQNIGASLKKLAERISSEVTEGLFSPSGLSQIIEANVDAARIAGAPTPCYVTCFSVQGLAADYIDLSGLAAREQIRSYLLASSAIPGIFPMVEVNDRTYYDGGLRDNVPLKPLYEQTGIRKFLVVHLSHKGQLDPEDFPDARVVQLNPSENLGNFITGTLNFDPDTIQRNIALGYGDMERALTRIL